MHVTIVTITNRKRWHLLQRTLGAAFSEGADRALVVDNAAEEDISARMAESFPGRYEVIRLEKNLGPAGAYHAGLKAAVESGAEFLLLLDDDNMILRNGLAALKAAYSANCDSYGKGRFCVAAYRPDQESERSTRSNSAVPSRHRFLGFHFLDLPAAAWRRRPWAARRGVKPRPEAPFARGTAPWGGLFFHRSVIDTFGYPDPSFVLYGEDTEFTMRITRAGGTILVVPQALIEDIEPLWTSGIKRMPFFRKLLLRGSDDQVYYQVRNRTYLETRDGQFSWVRLVNRMLLTSLMWMTARYLGKMARFRLVLEATRDGQRGKLGFREPDATRKAAAART